MDSDWKTIRLKCLRPVYERQVIREKAPAYLNTQRFSSSRDIYELMRDFQLEAKEHFLALHLDTKNRLLCLDRVSVGSLSASVVHPREVYKSALLSSAAAIILVHNHPSGDTTPSREDLELTQRLKEAGALLGIRVMDHIIIGDDAYLSFADRGLL